MSRPVVQLRTRRGPLAWLTQYVLRPHGAVAPILALALIPIVGCMGLAAEASNWWLTQRSLQNAADTAALAAAIDAGANYNAGGSSTYYSTTPVLGYPISVPANCTSAPNVYAAWYCQAMQAAAKYGYVNGAGNVTVAPSVVTCPGSTLTSKICYQVTITKNLPLLLLQVVGYNGNIGGNLEQVGATAIATSPGPPIDYCVLTTNGDIGSNGTNGANLNKCSTFSNGNTRCNGNGIQSGYSNASGTSDVTCEAPPTPTPLTNQAAVCDPYGPTVQTIQGANVSCPFSTNASASIPPAPAGCTAASANTLNSATKSGSFPVANIITATTVSGATGGLIQVCGNASFGSGTVTAKGSGSSVDGCSSTVSYSGSANLEIVVYNGGLDLNGCTFENTSTGAGVGGVTIIFAPIGGAAGSACPNSCYPVSNNNTGGEIDIAAPPKGSGAFSGLAILQSTDYTETTGFCNGSGAGAGPLDWCNAGNSPNLRIQGLIDMANGNLEVAGAIGMFDQAGALNCLGLIAKSFSMSGTGLLLANSSQCPQAGAVLPTVPGLHTYYQALVG